MKVSVFVSILLFVVLCSGEQKKVKILQRFDGYWRSNPCEMLRQMAQGFWESGRFSKCKVKNERNGVQKLRIFVELADFPAQVYGFRRFPNEWLMIRMLNQHTGACSTTSELKRTICSKVTTAVLLSGPHDDKLCDKLIGMQIQQATINRCAFREQEDPQVIEDHTREPWREDRRHIPRYTVASYLLHFDRPVDNWLAFDLSEKLNGHANDCLYNAYTLIQE